MTTFWLCSRSTGLWVLLVLMSGPLWGVRAAGDAHALDPTPWSVVVADDRLTVQLDQVPLSLVLAEVARQAGLRVSGSDGTGDMRVSASFRDLPLADGLRRLLRDRSYVLVDAPAPPGTPMPRRMGEILVLTHGQPRSAAQPAGDPGETAVAERDPSERIRALQAWVQQRTPEEALDPLTYALVDPDEQVRARAQELWEGVLAEQAATPPVCTRC